MLTALALATTLWLGRYHLQDGINVSRSMRKMTALGQAQGLPTPDVTPDAWKQNEASNRPDALAIRRAIEARNVAINFWGKVVDQDGVPLPDVRVAYAYSIYHGNDLGVAWIDHEERKGETTSDSGGLFAITDLKGHDLTIESLSKPGYVRRERGQLTYDFGGDATQRRFESLRENPVRVTMIQKSATESLIHVKGGLEVRGDGTPGRWSLWQGEPDPDGELVVTLRREPTVPRLGERLVTWSADLQVVGGEIMEVPWEEEVHRAPESGYSATVQYPRESQKEGVPHRSFYLRTADGKYGRIQVQLYPYDDGPTARCFITADMNPRPGSRNLEPTEEE